MLGVVWTIKVLVGHACEAAGMAVVRTEGDVVRGRPPGRSMLHWCCAIVDRQATGAVCTLRRIPLM